MIGSILLHTLSGQNCIWLSRPVAKKWELELRSEKSEQEVYLIPFYRHLTYKHFSIHSFQISKHTDTLITCGLENSDGSMRRRRDARRAQVSLICPLMALLEWQGSAVSLDIHTLLIRYPVRCNPYHQKVAKDFS